MATLRLEKLKKTYGTLTVLHEISLDVDDGEFVALVGPSGCGKSTLLQLIAGLEDASGGRIHIRDQVVNDRSPKDRNVAMVFQNYALYPHMTVAANMGFSLKLAGVSPAESAARVKTVAETLGISELLQRYPRQLSGGQRQRVAMGRAIVRDPDVFLFDEPLSNLDAKLRVQMRGEIKGLHQRLRTTTIYVTHDQIEAMTMADRIVVMQKGHIEQAGTPMELYSAPVNAFVAGFIGTPMMNFLGGTIEATGDGGLIFRGDGGSSIALPATARPAIGDGRLLGLRPQHLQIVADGVPAQVVMVEPTGAETHVHLTIGSDKVLCVANGHVPLQPGDSVAVRFDPANLYIFDAGDGRRIPLGALQ